MLQKHLKYSQLQLLAEERGDEVSVPPMEDIVETVVNYPFRPGGRRFVVLLTGPSSPEVQNVTRLQHQLWDHDVSLIQVSADLDFARVISASWDGHVMCQRCNKDQISIAATPIGKLAAGTRGMYMSFDTLKKGRSRKMRKLMSPFERIVHQPSPLCAGVVRGGA
ncbi:hypothetical protein ACOMHN_003065 [Nucella lapillus]